MTDRHAREHAVDPRRSVIVQAPAGSGKTTLLVERYLGLLATVESPEEILAITFTRKAAAEMRERVLRYLEPGCQPDGDHEITALEKARAVADRVEAWGLRHNPQRLLIRTIDSFNHYLARTMPVASRLGPVPAPSENTLSLYHEAARRTLDKVDSDQDVAEDVARLLLWRDHRSQDIEDLLVAMLGKRDQWLRVFGRIGAPDRGALEAALNEVVVDQLGKAAAALDHALGASTLDGNTLMECLRQAAADQQSEDKTSPLTECSDLTTLPGSDPGDLPAWRALGFVLLTNAGAWRKSVNRGQGCPPGSAHKDTISALLEHLGEDQDLAGLIDRARNLPQPRYDDEQWTTLAALWRVLTHCAGELELLFAESGQSDFAALGAAALRGLGDEDEGYTDLALYLDRRIGHILVDEYQDTNWGQFHLLEKLVAGWQDNEGRSLFLVGDPMQSIYRFREAEVGLFMRTRDDGIGTQALESLQLTRNFRSRAEIVAWVNERIGPAFPPDEDVAAGAVRYAPSEASRDTGGKILTIARPDRVSEAEAVASTVAEAIAAHRDDEDFTAAIIVRARSHLAEILPALDRHGVRYRAVKLDPLLNRPVVRDLLAITRAILDPADRTAVLSMLRSPVCGLTLSELHALAGHDQPLDAQAASQQLQGEPRQRALRVFDALEQAQALWHKRSVHDLVEGLWKRLGGSRMLARPGTEMREARRYLDALLEAESAGILGDWNAFMERLAGEHTEGDPDDPDVRLEILTMHGAKGLEWDLVLLPGLDRGTGGANQALLHWLPFTPDSGQEQVLLAPLRAATEADNTPLIHLIRAEEKQRETFEDLRLLYVAATRARDQLVLTASLDPGRDEIRPAAGSLLARLWPTCCADFLHSLEQGTDGATEPANESSPIDQSLRRVPAGWQPEFGQRLDWQPKMPPRERAIEIEFNWAGTRARRIGTVLHRLLERVGRIGIENLSETERAQLSQRIPALLRALGCGSAGLDDQAALIRTTFEHTLASENGRWILSNRHQHAACELPVSGIIEGRLVNAVIDRTFIDEAGTRWIIDYKSGYHQGADLDHFLAEEAGRYQLQLATYRRLFEQMGETDIRTALYLPRHDRLQETDSSR